jgi:hypothetical protein
MRLQLKETPAEIRRAPPNPMDESVALMIMIAIAFVLRRRQCQTRPQWPRGSKWSNVSALNYFR